MSNTVQLSENSHPTPTVEDYLMTMHVLERDQGEIVAARLAEILDVAPATVAMTLKRMLRDSWISGKGRQEGIHLTETGRAAAHSVVRRHMLTEWLLLKILKVPYLQIHAEAHQLEHAISASLEERLMDILEAPQLCPHGNPFPGFEGVAQDWLPLSEIPAGEWVTIRRLHEFAEGNMDLLKFLIENGIMPGVKAELSEVLPFNQTLTLNVSGHPIVLGFNAAHTLYGEII
jgi:DtxR family transcriptional regulator, iron-dependent repressor